MRWTTAAAIAWLALSACERGAPTPPEGGAPPVSRAEAAVLFARHCAICHGDKGDGQGPRRASLFRKPPDFRSPGWREGKSASKLRDVIRHGIPGSDMPAWPSLEPAQIAGLADYVLGLGSAEP